MYHSWYLSCDVHSTIIFTFLTYLFSGRPHSSLTKVSFSIYLLVLFSTFAFTLVNGWSSMLFDGANAREWEMGWYSATWFRIGTYALGVGVRGLQEVTWRRLGGKGR